MRRAAARRGTRRAGSEPQGPAWRGNGASHGKGGPRRTCIGCGTVASPTALVRLRRGPLGGLLLGPGPGRGTWLCQPPHGLACLDRARRRGLLARALRAEIAADDVDDLRARLERTAQAGSATLRSGAGTDQGPQPHPTRQD